MPDEKDTTLPVQPVLTDESGVLRFRANPLVRWLLDAGPHNMNDLALVPATNAERSQFAQLIGYSVDGYRDLSYAVVESDLPTPGLPSPEQALEAEIRALDDEMKGLAARRAEALAELLKLRSPYQTGDLIEFQAGSQKWLGRVEAIMATYLEPDEWACRRIRQDGTATGQTFRAYWPEKIRLIERGGGS